tara:strand:+ start:4011 stop:4703 length:693 start_codon:yes stop_codon:yes gene_type:complete
MELLINGDCIEEMTNIETDSIDLLFCDLPYGQTHCEWDCLIDLDLFWKEVNRICKETTPMFFTTTTKFGVSLINSNPKNFRYDMVWKKSNSTGHLNAKKMPMRTHEMIYVFYRKLPSYDLSSHTKHEQKKVSNDHTPVYGKQAKHYKSSYEPHLPSSILEFSRERGKHSTQKPVSLIEWILKYYTKEGDKILDPTMGSGSTGVACKNMNRKFIGIEKDKDIYDTAVKRLE